MIDGQLLPPIHPGEILLEEFLEPMHISQYRLAHDIGVPPRRINEIDPQATAPIRRTRPCACRGILASPNGSG